MLRYRPTEIRLTPEDVDGASRRLAARQAAGHTRNAVRPPPQLASSAPRIRRGPQRSRDESIVHQDADLSATSSSACTESVQEFTSDDEADSSPSLDASSLTELLRRSKLELPFKSDGDVSSSDLDISDNSEPEPDTVLRVGLEQDDKEVCRQTSPTFGNHGFDFSGFGRPVPQYDGSSEAPRYPVPIDVIGKNDSAVDITEPQKVRPQISQRVRSFSLALRSPLHQTLSRSPSVEPGLAIDCLSPQSRVNDDPDIPANQVDPIKRPPIPYRPRPITFPSRDDDMFGTLQRAATELRGSTSPAGYSPAAPTIRLIAPDTVAKISRPSTERTYSKESVTRHSLPLLPTLSPFGPLIRPASDETQPSKQDHVVSRQPSSYFGSSSPPDSRFAPTAPRTAPPSARKTSAVQARPNSSVDLSSTGSAGILDLLRQVASPLERLEQISHSRSLRAPSTTPNSTSPREPASRRSSAASEAHRMPTFESPDHSPARRKPVPPRPRRPAPLFAELPSRITPTSYDPLTSQMGFGSSPPLDTAGFDNRYPPAGSVDGVGNTNTTTTTTTTTNNNNNNNNTNTRPSSRTAAPTSMPSLHSSAPHPYRRRTAAPVPLPSHRTSRHPPNYPWIRSTAAPAGEARRNTIAGSRQRRSHSTRFPAWQDEQENSGQAEREALMAEVRRRRRFVEDGAGGRLDRTPPGVGLYERRALDG